MTPKKQVLARYTGAYCYKFSATQLYEVWAPGRTTFNDCIVWNCATPMSAWREALEYLDKELLRKLES